VERILKEDIKEFKNHYWEKLVIQPTGRNKVFWKPEIEEKNIKTWENQTLDYNDNFILCYVAKLNKKHGVNNLTQWYKVNGYDSFVFAPVPEFDFVSTWSYP
jgi:hypothetical protein